MHRFTDVTPRRRLLGTFAMVVILAGCSSGSATPSPQATATLGTSSSIPAASTAPSAAASFTPTTINVIEDYPSPHWIAQVAWWLAKDKGFYSDVGLTVNFMLPPTPPDPAKFIATGKVDMGISYTPDLLTAASQGLDFAAVASLMDRNTEGIMCRSDAGVKTPQDLVGKTVAIYDFPMAQLNWSLFLEHYGIDPSKVNKVSEGNYGVPLIVANKAQCIDAAAPEELVDARLQMKQPDAPFFLYDTSQGIPNFYWFVIAANRSFANQNPEAVKRFVGATIKGLQYAQQHPDEAKAEFLKIAPDQDPTLAQQGWDQISKIEFNADGSLNRFYPSDPVGFMRPDLWQSFQQVLVDHKLIDQPVDVTKYVTNAFLPGQ